MALDEPHGNDETFTEKGIVFLVDKGLFEDVKPISIDFVQTERGAGFAIKSQLSTKSSCGSCSC